MKYYTMKNLICTYGVHFTQAHYNYNYNYNYISEYNYKLHITYLIF